MLLSKCIKISVNVCRSALPWFKEVKYIRLDFDPQFIWRPRAQAVERRPIGTIVSTLAPCREKTTWRPNQTSELGFPVADSTVSMWPCHLLHPFGLSTASRDMQCRVCVESWSHALLGLSHVRPVTFSVINLLYSLLHNFQRELFLSASQNWTVTGLLFESYPGYFPVFLHVQMHDCCTAWILCS